VLGVSTSGYYEWLGRPESPRVLRDKELTKMIREIHEDSRGTYGWPRIHAELTLGMGEQINHKRVRRLMRQAGLQGLYRRRGRGCTVRNLADQPAADLVNRAFTADGPDRLWVADITEHPTVEGKVYCAAVMDVYSRRIVGWSIAEHMRAELVIDALGMATLRREPVSGGTILHSDHGSQYTAWSFGKRLEAAGILPSMGSVGDCYDNAMMESFWGTMQLELLDSRAWRTRHQLANAIFEWIECWYNSKRRHSSIGMRSPAEFETRHTPPHHDG